MCLTHWRRVPRRLHAPIYEGYNEYKGTGRLPRSYGDAVREAIAIASANDQAKPQTDLFSQ